MKHKSTGNPFNGMNPHTVQTIRHCLQVAADRFDEDERMMDHHATTLPEKQRIGFEKLAAQFRMQSIEARTLIELADDASYEP
jgi:hypothetical protein